MTAANLDGGTSDALYERDSSLVVVLAGAVDVHQASVVNGQARCGVSLQASYHAALGPYDAPQIVLAHLNRAKDGPCLCGLPMCTLGQGMIVDKHQIMDVRHSIAGQLCGGQSSGGKGHSRQRQLGPDKSLCACAHLVHGSFQCLELCREGSSCFCHRSTHYVKRDSACN